jgi:hypothetical protein
MAMAETTLFADNQGKEIFLGDVVRAQIKEPFQDTHGTWAEYEITKAAGGYVLSYVRSEKGCILPFGYTAQFMNQYEIDELPDLKMLLWSDKPVQHPELFVVTDGMTPEQRRDLFMDSRKRKRAVAG